MISFPREELCEIVDLDKSARQLTFNVSPGCAARKMRP